MSSDISIEINLEKCRVYSSRFDDIYFNPIDGKQESEHVFLSANRLPIRFVEHLYDSSYKEGTPFVITETGFGTGLNFFLLLEKIIQLKRSDLNCFRDRLFSSPYHSLALSYYSVEGYPLKSDQICSVLHHLEFKLVDTTSLLNDFVPFWENLTSGWNHFQIDLSSKIFSEVKVDLYLFFGNLESFLPELEKAQVKHKTHVWFLDGFAPSKNPSMWSFDLFLAMRENSASDSAATFSTFTVAGNIRRSLEKNQFETRKIKGHGHKREMLTGIFQN